MNRPLIAALDAYAAELLDAGFTVYLPDGNQRNGSLEFFYYSQTVDGQECYGIAQFSQYDGPTNTMPLVPSRLNGSSAIIGGAWGDLPTLNLDNMNPHSVEYARAVARPSNWCPFNAEPTPEAVAASNRNTGTPEHFYRGATLKNGKPSTIGTQYHPARLTWELAD